MKRRESDIALVEGSVLATIGIRKRVHAIIAKLGAIIEFNFVRMGLRCSLVSQMTLVVLAGHVEVRQKRSVARARNLRGLCEIGISWQWREKKIIDRVTVNAVGVVIARAAVNSLGSAIRN